MDYCKLPHVGRSPCWKLKNIHLLKNAVKLIVLRVVVNLKTKFFLFTRTYIQTLFFNLAIA